MVFAMAVIGAITRLTESGLSMVEWKPLIGVIPPLDDAEWQRVFDLYRATPEYRLKNADMDLAGFQQLFFWELGRASWRERVVQSVSLSVVAVSIKTQMLEQRFTTLTY